MEKASSLPRSPETNPEIELHLPGEAAKENPFERGRLMADIGQTATTATLISGFSLSLVRNWTPEVTLLNAFDTVATRR